MANTVRRAAVLQRVQQLSLMEDNYLERKRTLRAHPNKIESLFRRNTLPVGSNQPLLSLPYDYDYTYDDHLSAPIMQDILIAALACDKHVLGHSFANAQDHGFEWLWSENGDQPIVDRSRLTIGILWFMPIISQEWSMYIVGIQQCWLVFSKVV